MSKLHFEDIIFLIAAALIFVLRLWIGREFGGFISAGAEYDDFLMMRYADLHAHFIAQNLPYNFLLIKDMGFPIFLNFVHFSGLPYIDCLSILWLISAVIITRLFNLVTGVKDRRILFLVYVFVLFMPAAFSYAGRRIYRQAFLTPMYFINLGMMTILFAVYWNKIKISFARLILFNIILGGVFTLTFYVKEDGVWLLMCLAFASICSVAKNFFNDGFLKEKFIHAIIIFIPLIIFAAGTVSYKSINEKYFGVYLINDRTEGELGRFVKNVYKTKSEQRTSRIWAPTDVIEKFFETSQTLRESENLRNSVMHTVWYSGDIKQNPIQGDFLTWVMMTELLNSGTCNTAVEQEIFLKKVNDEIDAAFEAGILQKDDKFQLISSMGGYSLKEIFDLRKLIGKAYQMNLFMTAYGETLNCNGVLYPPNVDAAAKENFRADLEKFSALINLNLLATDDNAEFRQTLAGIIFKIYTVINFVLFLAALISIFKTANFSQNFLQYLLIVGFFLLSLVYAFAIAWFSAFLGFGGILIYSNGIIPMITIFEIFGAYRLFIHFRKG